MKTGTVNEVVFKRQLAGLWRRTDSQGTTHVNEGQLKAELQILINDGWKVSLHESVVDQRILGINLKK